MKLSQWAKLKGVPYFTAWQWFNKGQLPVRSEKTPSGMILVFPEETSVERKVVVYARVSSSDQKADLERQVSRIVSRLVSKKVSPDAIVKEIGSGMNGHRKQFLALLRDRSVTHIVVEHRDRLTRFGFDYIEAALQASGRRIIVLETSELKEDLVKDITDFMTSVCARLYGKRSALNKAKRAAKELET